MKEIKLNIQDHLRAGDVTRWHIVATARKQSLAEHQFNVAMIARAIGEEMHLDIALITEIALFHDMDEVVIGDIPTPTKERLNKYNIKWPGPKTDTHWPEVHVVKCADLIEAMWFLENNGIGRHADQVKTGIVQIIDSIMLSQDTPKELINAISVVTTSIYDGELSV